MPVEMIPVNELCGPHLTNSVFWQVMGQLVLSLFNELCDTHLTNSVFWRVLGQRVAQKNDTTVNSLVMSDLRPGLTYEVAVKAGNHKGTSVLTPTVTYRHGISYVSSASTHGEALPSPTDTASPTCHLPALTVRHYRHLQIRYLLRDICQHSRQGITVTYRHSISFVSSASSHGEPLPSPTVTASPT